MRASRQSFLVKRVYSDLVQPRAVHRSVYTDPDIFAAEQERIFRRAWLYVGHESQVPKPGDFLLTRLGPDEVLLVRQADRSLALLHNRCTHRGARVLTAPRGNARQFTCAYHAWSFDLDGSLTGVPLPEGYSKDFRYDDKSLARVPRVASYRGFVFGSHAASGPDLPAFLGGITSVLDNMVDRAPGGSLTQTGGRLHMEYRGNWKFFLENAADQVHPGIVHVSAVAAARADREAADLPGMTGQVVQMQLANGLRAAEWNEIGIHGYPGGHAYMGSFYRGAGVIAAERKDPVFQRYLAALTATHGEAKVQEILAMDRFNNLIWPTITVNSRFQVMRVVQPVAVDHTVVTSYCFALDGAPDEMTALSMRFLTAAASSGSLVAADDLDIFERCQRGLEDAATDWVDLSRGFDLDRTAPDGSMSAPGTSELHIRNQFTAWERWMKGSPE